MTAPADTLVIALAQIDCIVGDLQGNANRIYFAGNHWHNGFGIDREAMAIDGPYYSYWIGKPGRCDGNTFTAPDAIIHYQFRRPVTDGELAARRAAWAPPAPLFERGYRALFQRHVLQAPDGCDFDFLRLAPGRPVGS